MKSKRRIKIKRKSLTKLKWGVAGCGNFTEFGFLPALQLLKRSKLVSVYSSQKNRAENIASKFNATDHFDNFSEFLKSDFNSLYIGSKNSDHYLQVLEAAKAGKNILCEKPMSLTSVQAEQMVVDFDRCNEFVVLKRLAQKGWDHQQRVSSLPPTGR